ncbi:MAG TPA: hypothetical protein VG010_05585, partial [Solirubrobacteraceae bacterium]|nr:hypothetical protein [Solirubrobacteraceae bacterium]
MEITLSTGLPHRRVARLPVVLALALALQAMLLAPPALGHARAASCHRATHLKRSRHACGARPRGRSRTAHGAPAAGQHGSTLPPTTPAHTHAVTGSSGASGRARVAAGCEDGSQATQTRQGSLSCADGSEPTCADGSSPARPSPG